jgi:type IV secretory pathway VirB10-like protein
MSIGDRFRKIKSGIGGVKTRSLLVVFVIIILIVAVLVWTGLRDTTGVLEGASKTKGVKPLESLPGTGVPSVVYDPLQQAQNKENAEAAKQSGGSAVPSLINQGADGYARSGFGNLNDNTGRCGDECYDQSGFDAQGFDRNGFDKDGYDKNGYDKDGYDRNGFDRQGYDRDGFNKKGCNRQGFNREGKPCAEALFGADCFNELGKDKNGCDKDGKDAQGAVCYDAKGFNKAGYDKCGLNANGLDANGRDCNACDKDGKDANGKVCYDASGYTSAGLDKSCRDRNGFDKNGLDKDGYDKDGYDKDGYDRNGFDKNGCNREGKNKEGRPCYNAKGFTEQGFDRAGYDTQGFGHDGLDRQGYDKNGLDKDGYDRMGFNKDGCNKDGKNRDGKSCKEGGSELAGLLTEGAASTGTTAAPDAQARAQMERLMAEQRALEQTRIAALTAQQQQDLVAQQQAQIAAFESLMSTQAQNLIAAWAPPKQAFVKGNYKEKEVTTLPVKEGREGLLPATGTGPLIYKAGDIAFAIIDTSINSDQPGPVMARIVSGPLKGSKILGTFERQDTKLLLTFTTLSIPSVPQSISMDAIAIDPETARTALATDVDHHYLTKYGTLMASSFLQGMGQAVETSIGTPDLSSSGSATIASTLPATTRDQVIVGLGAVGTAIANDINKQNIQPTVTLDSGTGVGLLIMSDLRIEEPAPQEAPAATPPATTAPAAGGTPPSGIPSAVSGSGPVPGAGTVGVGSPPTTATTSTSSVTTTTTTKR